MPNREPWVKFRIGLRRSGKMAGLTGSSSAGDSARLGWCYVLLEAKVQRQLGVFDNRAHFAEVMGRFGRFLDQYVEAGLAHEAPRLCAGCLVRHADVRPGEIVVHDYLVEQRDPTNADRQAAYRGRLGEPESNADRNGADNADVTPTVTAHSRARGTTATTTGTETEDSSLGLSAVGPRT